MKLIPSIGNPTKSLLVALALLLIPLAASSQDPVASDAPPRRRLVRIEPLERVLMPFLGEEGFERAYWAAQILMRNESERSIKIFFPFPCPYGVGCDPPRPFDLAPLGSFENRNLVGSRGIFLHIERGRLPDLAYSLRVEDLSGLADPYHVVRGTELPLIPESRFGRSVTLLNVPVAGGLERVLRVYGSTSETMSVTIELYLSEWDKETLLLTLPVALAPGRVESGYEAYPAFAMVDLTPTFAAIESQIPLGRATVRVIAEGDARVWAFLAVIEPNDRSFTAITPGR